ncbi:MAG: hypothetical protein AW11_03792 [Candidatus Accumulibacter regalis]|uniref:Uncharacterized protein n=1 Tax=Accumulibacter regalis TaxID=522306 RepID=A0A011R0D9_ACCRE|nr:MAG: hypothetical protein AW11_03792 [Candidatus Accumulibacter regalis]
MTIGVGDDQPRPVTRVAAVEQASAQPFALFELRPTDERHIVAPGQLDEALGHSPQRVNGGDRRVLIELDDVEAGDANGEPRRLVKARIGLHDAAQQRLDRRRHRQVGRRVVAEQQRSQRQFAFVLAEHVDHLQQIAQDAGTHRLGQIANAEVAIVGTEAGDDRPGEAATVAFLLVGNAQDDARRAARAGVQTQVVALGELAVEQFAVDQRLGAGDRVLLVVAEQNRLGQETQVHGLDGDLQATFRSRRDATAWRTAKQTARHRLAAVERWRSRVVDHRQRLFLAAHRRRAAQQAAGHAVAEQLAEGGEILARRRQVAMLGGQVVVAADVVDTSRSPADRAVPLAGADHFQAPIDLAYSARRIARDAKDIDGLSGVGLGQRRRRLAVLCPQPVRRVELLLVRRRRIAVAEPQVEDLLAVVDPGFRQPEILPVVTAVWLPLEDIDETRLGKQLQGAAESGDDLQHLAHVVPKIEAHQRAQRITLAEQVLDHRVGPLIGRPEHHQARAVARHQRVDHRAALVDAGAHYQAAHAVREQAHRLRRFAQQAVEEFGKAFGEHIQRLPPVVGEALDTMAGRQILADVAVEHLEELLGLDARLLPGNLAQATRGNVQRVEPDAVRAIHREVRTHHPGQHDDHRQVGTAHLRRARHGAHARFAVHERTRQGLESSQRQDLVGDQPVAQRKAGIDVREVAEMRDFGAAVEQRTGPRLRRDAGEHRVAIDDQVVVDVVEKKIVGEQDAETLEQIAAFDVAGNHRHLDARAHRCVAQQAGHRRVRQHRFDAGHQMRIGALVRDFQNHALESRIERVAEEERHLPDQRQHPGKEEVQVAARQPRPLRRTGDAYVALHAQLPGRQRAGQLAQLLTLLGVRRVDFAAQALRFGFALAGVAGTRQIGLVLLDQPVEVVHAEQIGNQAAARVRDQAELKAVGQRREQLEGVFDRALGERAVLVSVDAAAEVALQDAPQITLVDLQVAKTAERVRPGAMHEKQDRPFLRRRPLQLAPRARQRLAVLRLGGATPAVPAVNAGRPTEPRLDRPHQRPRSQPADAQFGDVASTLAQLAELVPGGVDDFVAGAPHRQRKDLADQAADGVAEQAARRRPVAAQAIEENLAVAADQLGPAAQQRGLELARRSDQYAAVGEFDDQHLVVLRRVLLGAGAGTAHRGADLEAGARLQVSGGQERILGLACRTTDALQQRRQLRLVALATSEVESSGISHHRLHRVRATPGAAASCRESRHRAAIPRRRSRQAGGRRRRPCRQVKIWRLRASSLPKICGLCGYDADGRKPGVIAACHCA